MGYGPFKINIVERFKSDEDALLGDDNLLVDNSSDENYDEIAINHANQDETNDNDKKDIECLTKHS